MATIFSLALTGDASSWDGNTFRVMLPLPYSWTWTPRSGSLKTGSYYEFTEDGATDLHGVEASRGAGVGVHVLSLEYKPIGPSVRGIYVDAYTGTSTAYCQVTGTTVNSTGATGTGAVLSVTSTAMGDGYYRVVFTFSFSEATTNADIYLYDGATNFYAGANDGTGIDFRNVGLDADPGGSGAKDRVRVKFESALAGTGFNVDHASIGIWTGSDSDTTATPTELLFSGGHGFSLVSPNVILSDWTTFKGFSASDYLIVIFDVSAAAGSGSPRDGPLTGVVTRSHAAAASYNSATTPAGSSGWGDFIFAVSLIETMTDLDVPTVNTTNIRRQTRMVAC